MSSGMKKVLIVGVVALVLFFLITQPTQSADFVHRVLGWLKDPATPSARPREGGGRPSPCVLAEGKSLSVTNPGIRTEHSTIRVDCSRKRAGRRIRACRGLAKETAPALRCSHCVIG